MANSFKNSGVAITTSRTTLYTCPANTTAVITGLFVSNVDGTSNADVTIEATVDGGTTYIHVGKTLSVPADSTMIVDKAINLEAGDILACTSSAAGDLEAFASIMEIV